MFFEKIKENRIRLGLSVKQVAEKLGVSENEVEKWESGLSMPDLETAIRLSDLYEVTVDYLFKNRKSDSDFSYYTVVKEDKQPASKHKIISLAIFCVSIIAILTLLTIALTEPITYVDGTGQEFTGMKAYMLEYQEFNTAVIFSSFTFVMSGISLFVPEDKLRKLFIRKM